MTLEGLGGLIKGLESQESWQVQRQFRLVLMHWPKAVGFAVARRTRPISIQRGTLYVATATASWAQTLSYERVKVLKKLNRHQHLPLTDIRFSTAQWSQAQQTRNLTANGVDSTENTTDKRDTVSARLAQHPSYIGKVLQLPARSELQNEQTPQGAFQNWATAIQEMQRVQAICPICRCRCPQGELDRWARCGHCATKRWQ